MACRTRTSFSGAPRAALLRSPCFLMPASLMMKPQKPPRAASSPANGSLVMNLTAYLPAGSTLSTAMKSDLPGDFSKSRSNVNFTSAEVSSWPSWNFTPSRSLTVHVSPSGLVCHDSASSGTGVMSGSKRTSWLYIIDELRIEAGRFRRLRREERASRFRCLPEGGRAADAEGAEGEAGGREEVAAVEVPGHGGLLVQLLGSRTSRRPSPIRLNASTVSMMARPGKTEIQGAVSRYVRPSLSMLPHDGVGGCADSPR